MTGAGGFIGSHLVELLVRSGCSVTAFLHYNSRGEIGLLEELPPATLDQVKIVFGDLKDFHSVAQAMRGHEVVFHLGALIGIPYSYLNPKDVMETNVMGTLNVLMAAKEQEIRRVIHTSTSEVYGTAQTAKIREDHPLQGQSPYSASKIGADKLVESFVASYRLPVVTIRPFNTFGPRQSMRAVIPTIIGQACFQDEIAIGTLDTVRDFTYVTDTVDAFVRGATTEGIEGKTFNLGGDREQTIREVVETVFRLLDCRKPIRVEEKRMRPARSEVRRLRADNSLAKEVLHWSPQTSFEEGLLQTIRFIQSKSSQYTTRHYVI